MTKQITLNLTGYEVDGVSLIRAWGGGKGAIKMNPITYGTNTTIDEIQNNLTVKDLNDGGFGCESIIGAYVNFYEVYEGNYKKYAGEMFIGNLTEEESEFLFERSL